MYGKTSGSVNPNLSPRSKIISLGLNQVEAPPLRFRPLVKAADFPFTDQVDRTENKQNFQNTQYDYYNDEAESKAYDQGSFPPSPDELRSQYTDFQKQLIAEQLSGNYDHEQDESRAQTLAHGLEYQGYLSASSPTGADKEKLRMKYADYQKKMVADETHLIEPTRQKFVRKNIDEDFGPGLVIGKQMDKETEYRTKREAQAAYQRQLSNDIRSKPISGDRKIVDRRAHSPEPTQTNFMSRIGDRSDGSGMVGETEADRRRRETQQILASNREDVLARLHEASSPENRKMREYKAHNRVDETIKFEEAPYRFIGASTENAKDRKKAMQEQYLAQLLQDNGGPPQQYHNHNHHQQQQQQQKYQQEQYQQQQQQYQQGRSSHPSPDSRAEYVNRSGWTGLNIGGHSMDEANQGASKNEKFLKQAAYKRLLDQQRLQAEDLVRMDKMKYGKL